MGFLSGLLGNPKRSQEDIEREAAQELSQFTNGSPQQGFPAQPGAVDGSGQAAEAQPGSREQAASK